MLNELNFFPNWKNLKNSEKLGKKILSLPISEEHSEKEIIYISQKIKEFLNIKKNKINLRQFSL